MKRFLGLFLALVLLLGMIPTAAAADFTDVPDNSWYRSAVAYAVSMGLMNGIGDGKFDPDAPMSRAMLVTVLWRFAKCPAEGENNFSDVKDGLWYTNAIAWAAVNGIVTGVGGGKFDPDGTVTREQLAVILFRHSTALGMDTSNRKSLASFPDAQKVSPWASDALSWAVAEGMINGIQNGSQTTLAPQGSATRAQVAAILMRYILNFCNPDCSHTETKIVNAVAPTCTTDGYSGDTCCAVCGLLLSEGKTVNKLFHSYDSNLICVHCGMQANSESIQVGGNSYALGMSKAEVLSLAGNPDEMLPVAAGYTWYVYGTKNYNNFFMVGIAGDTVISLCATGIGFTYRGKGIGGTIPDVAANECRMRLCIDRNDNNIFYAVQLTNSMFSDEGIYSAETLAGESKANFHLTNAFRVYHGLSILKWSDNAAAAARLHSEDMAAQNYFSHYSLDGRNPGDRLRAQGVNWRSCAENICAGYRSAFDAYDGWVNSAGHRSNILSANMEYLGVGFAANYSSTYYIYATQNFFY